MHKKEIKTLQAEKENIGCRQHLCANLFAGSG